MKEKDELGLSCEDYAYIAGFMDADGCFSISLTNDKKGPPAWSGQVAAVNTNPAIPEWLSQVFGGKVKCSKPSRPNYKPVSNWSLYGKKSIPFLKRVIPFLRMKQERASLLLEFILYQREKSKEVYRKGTRGRGAYPVEVKDNLNLFYNEMKLLNLRGSKIEG